VTNQVKAPGSDSRHPRSPGPKRHVDHETERLMQNWARWRSGVSVSVGVSSAYQLEARGRRSETPMPLINGDAVLVDQAVEALPDGLKIVLIEYWVRGGRNEQKLKRCRCTERTFYRRLEDGNTRVRREVEARRKAIHARARPPAVDKSG